MALRRRGRDGAAARRRAGAPRGRPRPRRRDAPARPRSTSTLAALEQPLLPSPAERKLYALVDGRPRRLRLGRPPAPTSNLVCLRVGDDGTGNAGAAIPGDASPSSPAPATDVAAFSPGPSLGVVWTSVTAAGGSRLANRRRRCIGPSFGSPLVAGDRVVGLVASPTTAWPAAIVAAAAPRCPTAVRPGDGWAGRSTRPRSLGSPGRLLALRLCRSCWALSPDLPRGRHDHEPAAPRRRFPASSAVALARLGRRPERTVELVATDNMKFSTTTHRGPGRARRCASS